MLASRALTRGSLKLRACTLPLLRATSSSPSSAGAKSPELITTPIFYVNAAPHIGHLHTAVLSDSYARWREIRNPPNGISRTSHLATGTDEHGIKVQNAAAAAGVSTAEFCDAISRQFRDLFDLAGIDYQDYVRTTEARHRETVESLWETLVASGDIYEGTHEGWYCASEEAFVPESQLRPGDGGSELVTLDGHAVERVSETNFKFRLSKYIGRCARAQLVYFLFSYFILLPLRP